MAHHKRGGDDSLNPYIALSDLLISLVLVIVFFVALGKLNLVNIRYKRAMDSFAQKVQTLPPERRPRWERGRNDPPGVQRWVFDGRALFVPVATESDTAPPRLTAEGKQSLSRFAALLAGSQGDWTRIKVEGHTLPFYDDAPDRWELSARRAAVVVREIQIAGHIPPWFCGVSGRAGQNPLYKVTLVSRVGDTQGVMLRRDMDATGVRYTYRPPMNPARGAFLVERDSSGQEVTYSAQDAPAKRAQLVQHFKQNERVEVLIEYATRK